MWTPSQLALRQCAEFFTKIDAHASPSRQEPSSQGRELAVRDPLGRALLGFHVAYARLEPGAYGEHPRIELLTKCLRPWKFEGRETRFTFIGDRGMIGAIGVMPRGRTVPNGLGTLTMRGIPRRAAL